MGVFGGVVGVLGCVWGRGEVFSAAAWSQTRHCARPGGGGGGKEGTGEGPGEGLLTCRCLPGISQVRGHGGSSGAN